MKVEECYAKFGGDYASVKERLPDDALVQRFLNKFLADTSYERLSNAVREGDYVEAFRAAHTLKGVSQNLSLQRLSNSVSTLTELLRNKTNEEVDRDSCAVLFEEVSLDYAAVVEAVRQLQD